MTSPGAPIQGRCGTCNAATAELPCPFCRRDARDTATELVDRWKAEIESLTFAELLASFGEEPPPNCHPRAEEAS